MSCGDFSVRLPEWLRSHANGDRVFETPEERMRLVIELSRLNVEHGAGGPFGAAVFDHSSNRLAAVGVNLVLSSNCSVLHAEVVAIMMAQKRWGHYDLGAQGMPPFQLVTSTEPCAMCLGAVAWSGVRALVCGARDEDARHIGFDEGPKSPRWVEDLESRGIRVIRDVCRSEATEVLEYYAESGGVIYNGRQGRPS